ncbi:MAG: hypothetical protein A2Z48_11415 [Actinobacteria bacterium RBG_19FT_COMBO_70_19]|nr:MAG: hypothetical protein A2Z48_11415 [Actinobacteria bacterium RBG_19FT_COMBO_70_19]
MVTLKLVELVAVPPGVVTAIGPVVAPAGTVALIRVFELTVKVAEVPWNLTAVAPEKAVPRMTTEVPTGPLVGSKEVMVGTPVTVKLVELVAVPSESVTAMGPDVAPEGTVAVSSAFDPTVKVAAVPLNVTAVTSLESLKPPPLISTDVPTGPLVGSKDAIVGGAARAAGTPIAETANTVVARTTEDLVASRRAALVMNAHLASGSNELVRACSSPFGSLSSSARSGTNARRTLLEPVVATWRYHRRHD